jgi:tetratricopeptide (TPR) repeat protein
VSIALAGILGVLLATNQPVALSNYVIQATVSTTSAARPNDPVEKELSRIMEQDDAAQDEADRWIKENEKFRDQGAAISDAALGLKIEQRFNEVKKAYEEFLKLHPNHDKARVAYGSFLNDIGKELEAREQWTKATETDPRNAAAWNNLANYYGHRGPVTNSFIGYGKAIDLCPREPVYLRNLATTLYMFRQDAKEFFKLEEPQIFDRSLDLYRLALQLEPTNFIYASDLAQTYYGIKPERHDEAIKAWKVAMPLAHDELERQGIYVHLARWEIMGKRFASASNYLDQVVLPDYSELKKRLLRNISERQAMMITTNAPSTNKEAVLKP